MLPSVIGDLLPSAVGVALSPVPIIAVIVVLGSQRATSVGLALSAGWIAGLSGVLALVAALTAGAGTEGQPSTLTGWLKLAGGALFVVLAAREWRHRPVAGEVVDPPRWMAAIDSLTPGRAVAIGAGLSALNPKNLALTLAAAATIGESGLSTGRSVTAAIVFVAIGSVTVVGPTLWHLVAPRRAARPLAAINTFMSDHHAVIMMTVLVLLGAKLIGNGLEVVAG